MFERHAHRAEKLVEVVNGRARGFLGMERGERSVAGVERGGGLERQPAHAVGAHLRFRQPVAQCLEGGERAAELLAVGHMGDGAVERGGEQPSGFGGQRDAPAGEDVLYRNGMANAVGGHGE